MPGAWPIPPALSTRTKILTTDSTECTDGKEKRKFGKRDVFIRVIL